MVHGTRGMAATSHPLATATAIESLRAGGNAVDAAVAACAVQGVVEPQSTGIGGDCFALHAPGGRVPPFAINGSGPAPAGLSVDWFRERGIDAIGFESPHAVTVPGAVGTWERLLAEHGTKGLDEVLQPAIRYAEEGYVVHSRVAHDWAQNTEKLRACENARAIYLPGGRAPAAGTLHRLPVLAETLRRIARDGAAAFYTGPIADDIAAHLQAHGSLMTADDLAAFAPQQVEPISTGYRGFDIYECPPNGQGIIALLILNILEGFDLAGLDPVGPERLHLEAEATRLGYRDRAALIADPDAVAVPAAALLSEPTMPTPCGRTSAGTGPCRQSCRRAIRPMAIPSTSPWWTRTATRSRSSTRCSGRSARASARPQGVMLQNRGASFAIDHDHPNRIAGGKRPMHTIIPGMVGEGDHAVMPFGVMGGHFQPCGHAHFLTNVIDYGMDPQAALDCPRAFHFGGVLTLETTIATATAERLAALGHTVEWASAPHGGGQAIAIDRARAASSPAAPTRARTAARWASERGSHLPRQAPGLDRALLHQGVDHVDGGGRDACQAAEFADCADQGLDLHRPAQREVLEHGGAVGAHLLGARDALLHVDGEARAERLADRLAFHHHGADHGAGAGLSRAMSSSVAPVSTLTGLKARLPQSLTQMSERMSRRTGALKPAPMKARLSACTRSLQVPSGSPKGRRFWLRWGETSITPGSTISPAA